MTPEQLSKQASDRLYSRVGAFFTNTSRGPGRCRVCTGPAVESLCPRCAEQRATYGTQLADLVVPLAYARGNMYARDNRTPRHQSAHHMLQYKHRIRPAEECRRDLKLMMLTATSLHGECIARTVGWWEVLTFTPSASRPGTAHPLAELVEAVTPGPEPARVLLDIGPDIAAEPKRWPLPHRFAVSEQLAPTVAGRHVLLVDDTWVSGDKPQSAALALKAAGARAVTIICIARWLNWTYSEQHQRLILSLNEPYDARQCPVTGDTCPGPDAVVRRVDPGPVADRARRRRAFHKKIIRPGGS